jgi:hypothetical protein
MDWRIRNPFERSDYMKRLDVGLGFVVHLMVLLQLVAGFRQIGCCVGSLRFGKLCL